MRSFLFVPGDSERKFAKARAGNADALILDLEDSVAPDAKPAARLSVRAMLAGERGSQQLYVRVNAFDTGLTPADLAAVMDARPDGIVLPKCESAAQVQRLATMLDALEAVVGIEPGQTRIVGIATETAASLFSLGSYRDASPRLWGIMWGAEDLAASLGASANRDAAGFLEPYRLARNLCLAGAAAAGIAAIDTVATQLGDLEALALEAAAARRDGFAAKAVIHPDHVDVVNAAFRPSEAEIAQARSIVAAFAQSDAGGVLRLNGRMIDRPHLRAAERVLAMMGQP